MVNIREMRRSIGRHHVVGPPNLGNNLDHHQYAVGAIFVDSAIVTNHNFDISTFIARVW